MKTIDGEDFFTEPCHVEQNTIIVRPYGFLRSITIDFDEPIPNMDAASQLRFTVWGPHDPKAPPPKFHARAVCHSVNG